MNWLYGRPRVGLAIIVLLWTFTITALIAMWYWAGVLRESLTDWIVGLL
jgi:hypothetical protein